MTRHGSASTHHNARSHNIMVIMVRPNGGYARTHEKYFHPRRRTAGAFQGAAFATLGDERRSWERSHGRPSGEVRAASGSGERLPLAAWRAAPEQGWIAEAEQGRLVGGAPYRVAGSRGRGKGAPARARVTVSSCERLPLPIAGFHSPLLTTESENIQDDLRRTSAIAFTGGAL